MFPPLSAFDIYPIAYVTPTQPAKCSQLSLGTEQQLKVVSATQTILHWRATNKRVLRAICNACMAQLITKKYHLRYNFIIIFISTSTIMNIHCDGQDKLHFLNLRLLNWFRLSKPPKACPQLSGSTWAGRCGDVTATGNLTSELSDVTLRTHPSAKCCFESSYTLKVVLRKTSN